MYCLLIGGSFYYYKDQTDQKPQDGVKLKDVKLVSPAPDQDSKKTFAFLNGDSPVLVGQCGSDADLAAWLEAIKGNSSLEPSDPPAKAKHKKVGVMVRMKRHAASKGATSGLGKKVMKAIVNDETTTLLEALKRIVKAESGSAKKAEDLEKNIIKIAVKSFLLVDAKNCQPRIFWSQINL